MSLAYIIKKKFDFDQKTPGVGTIFFMAVKGLVVLFLGVGARTVTLVPVLLKKKIEYVFLSFCSILGLLKFLLKI